MIKKIIVGKGNFAFILIVLIYGLYAALFIYQTSFVINDERYFSLFDDGMVSMRFAKNLANGYGLVWNPGGERVEGYTNPLWVIYMSLFHLLPIAQSKISLFIQISGALFLIVNLFFVKKIADLISNNSTVVSLSAVSFTAFYLPLNNWGLQGMEVSILALLTSLSIWKTLQCIKLNKFSVSLYIFLGIGTLVRMDMIIIFMAILSFLIIADQKNRKKHLMIGLSSLIFFITLQTIFRFYYYGDILPNTYYLKMTGYPLLLRISRGLYVFLVFIWKMNWLLLVASFSVLLYRRDKFVLLLVWVFFLQVSYSIYVGGDAWERWGGNRFICIVMPIVFILFSYSLAQIGLFFANKPINFNIQKYTNYGLVAIVLISLVSFNSISGSSISLSQWLLLTPPLHVIDNEKMVETGLLLTKITNPEAKIAVVWAGAIPYFSDRYMIDLLGKNDKIIAHEKMRVRGFFGFYPGHLKWNYSYSIGQLKPDVVAQLWSSPEEAYPYLDANYNKTNVQGFTLYLLNGSSNIQWNKIEALNKENYLKDQTQ